MKGEIGIFLFFFFIKQWYAKPKSSIWIYRTVTHKYICFYVCFYKCKIGLIKSQQQANANCLFLLVIVELEICFYDPSLLLQSNWCITFPTSSKYKNLLVIVSLSDLNYCHFYWGFLYKFSISYCNCSPVHHYYAIAIIKKVYLYSSLMYYTQLIEQSCLYLEQKMDYRGCS